MTAQGAHRGIDAAQGADLPREWRGVRIAFAVAVAVAVLWCGAAGAQAATRAGSLPGPMVDDPACGANELAPNDNDSSGPVPLPFLLKFFGQTRDSLYVNNNGNVSFGAPQSQGTPPAAGAVTPPTIAPFFADVDTSGPGFGVTSYGQTTFEGRSAFCVNWVDVGYNAGKVDKTNSFQLLLVDRSDSAPGDFDIVFNYGRISWESGDASGGTNGLGGTSAVAGYTNGDGNARRTFELPGSRTPGALLDSNATTGLTRNSFGSTQYGAAQQPGRYILHVTSTGQDNVSLAGLDKPWPAQGWGYQFGNRGLGYDKRGNTFGVPGPDGWLAKASLKFSDVFNDTTLGGVFSNWTKRAAADRTSLTEDFGTGGNGGLCVGMALSGGRFNALTDPLLSPTAGRTDPTWSAFGTDAFAPIKLPEPGSAGTKATYNLEMVRLLALGWVSQMSTEVGASVVRQHYAFADRTAGVQALKAQLASIMNTGVDRYDRSGKMTGKPGFAMVAMADLVHGGGHAVMAYSARDNASGGVDIGVWDNNLPKQPQTIHVNGDGTFDYGNAYGAGSDAFLSGTYSLSGAGGREGRILALPLYPQTGLSAYPAKGGAGSTAPVDVPAGTDVSTATDQDDEPVDQRYVNTDLPHRSGGQIFTFPSGAGSLTISGDDPSLRVRGGDSSIEVEGDGGEPIGVEFDQHDGDVDSTDEDSELSVAREDQVIHSDGAGGLEYRADGSVAVSDLSGSVSVTSEFDHDGTTSTATLYQGAPPASGKIALSKDAVKAAQLRALAAPQSSPGKPAAPAAPAKKRRATKRKATAATKLAAELKACAKRKPAKRAACRRAARARYHKRVQAEKLAKALHRCSKYKGAKRATCRRHARARYAPKHAKHRPAKHGRRR